MSFRDAGNAYEDLLERARRAKAEWSSVENELRALAQSGSLSAEQQKEVYSLLGEEQQPQHRRFGPAPS